MKNMDEQEKKQEEIKWSYYVLDNKHGQESRTYFPYSSYGQHAKQKALQFQENWGGQVYEYRRIK